MPKSINLNALSSARKLGSLLFATLCLALCSWMTSQAATAQSFVLEIQVSPERAGMIPVYEVIWGDDVAVLDIYQFAQECELRAGIATGDDWSLTRLSADDLLQCSFHDTTKTLEIDLETTTKLSQLNQSPRARTSQEIFTSRFIPKSGYELRLRFGAQSNLWSQWVNDSLSRRLPVPETGQEDSLHFDVEMRKDADSPTVAMSGYVKVKKLHSGG